MRNNKVLSYFTFCSMCLFYYSMLYSAIAKQGTDFGDMSEGLVSIMIFLATAYVNVIRKINSDIENKKNMAICQYEKAQHGLH